METVLPNDGCSQGCMSSGTSGIAYVRLQMPSDKGGGWITNGGVLHRLLSSAFYSKKLLNQN
jgi:hypothetical protein